LAEAAPPVAAGLDRRALRERLSREAFDIAIIGGGITGAGIARDAALRGLSVALVEKGDFASGTSSRSSRLIHGGLRYLRHREVGLVREALRERGLLLRLAPHLVRPLPFVLPVYKHSRYGPLVLRVGLTGYDLLAGTRGLSRHRYLPAERLLQAEPCLRDTDLRGGFRYFDATADDARLTLEVALSAAAEGAAVINYVEAAGWEQAGGRIAGLHYRDVVSGETGVIRARAVVSAAGPWTDRVRALAGMGGLLRPTKGIHVVVSRARLAINAAIAFGAADRDVFAVPAGEFTYIGTTDTDYSGDPGAVAADGEDVAYLLDSANAAFNTGLTPSDVVSTWAGVRPLVRDEGFTSRVSRDYEVLEGPPGLYTICGGKLTTFRSMAQRMVDLIVEREGRSLSRRPGPCRTARRPLPGGAIADFPRYQRAAATALHESWGIPVDAAQRLIAVHGTEHTRVLALAAQAPDMLRPISPGSPLLAAEAAYAARYEMAMTLEDFFVRRCDLTRFSTDRGLPASGPVARLLARELGWSREEARRQVAAYEQAIARMDAFRSGEEPSAAGAAG